MIKTWETVPLIDRVRKKVIRTTLGKSFDKDPGVYSYFLRSS